MHHLAITATSTIHPYALDAWDRIAQRMATDGAQNLLVHKTPNGAFEVWDVTADGNAERRRDSAQLSSDLRTLHVGLCYHRYPHEHTVLAIHGRRWMASLNAKTMAWHQVPTVVPHTTGILLIPDHGPGAHKALARKALEREACLSPAMRHASRKASPISPISLMPHAA